MNGSLRNKIKRVACIACTALSLGGLNVSKSNAMSKGATIGVSVGTPSAVATLLVVCYFVRKNLTTKKQALLNETITNQKENMVIAFSKIQDEKI